MSVLTCVCNYHYHAGTVVTVLIIEFLGRKLTMASEFLAVGGSFLLLFICANQ